MELNRNHYFVLGVLLFLLGFQFRYVTSFVLNERSSTFVDRRFGRKEVVDRPFAPLLSMGPQVNRRMIQPPKWLGWSLMSIGGVLFFFSLTLPRPGS